MSEPVAPVCIIGAGSSGITAAQVLTARGVEVDVYEMGSEVGGNWRYDNDNGLSSAYSISCRTTRTTGRSRSTSTTSWTTSGCASGSRSAPRS